MVDDVFQRMGSRLAWAGVALLLTTLVGTVGYLYLADGQYNVLDCLYMTVITLTTIGYSEVVDTTNNPAARVFTMFIAVAGIGTLTYAVSTATAFIVEGELSQAVRRRKMEKEVASLKDHYIVCGLGVVAQQIIQELTATKRTFVVIVKDAETRKAAGKDCEKLLALEGDPTDADVLSGAGAAVAAGVFAVMDDDNENVIVALTARQMNASLRIVTQCLEPKNGAKMKAAGASATVSPTYIGGLRMASEMIRPAVVSFLDMMLRDKELSLRVEEIPAPCPGKTIRELGLGAFPNSLLLAIRGSGGWRFNPPADHTLEKDSVLVVMTTPDERDRVAKHVGSAG